MNNIEIYNVVEGQTEQTFIREVLAPYLGIKGIYMHPVLIGMPGHKGGDVRFDRAKADISRLLRQRKNIYVTTMFDFFRINKDWPGMNEIKRKIEQGNIINIDQKYKILEEQMKTKINDLYPGEDHCQRFIPYIQMHEFEALLFCDAKILADKAEIKQSIIETILSKYTNPEEINHEPENAPSKQLEKHNPAYRKVASGTSISREIGIETIRLKCPHFNQWLKTLEKLSSD